MKLMKGVQRLQGNWISVLCGNAYWWYGVWMASKHLQASQTHQKVTNYHILLSFLIYTTRSYWKQTSISIEMRKISVQRYDSFYRA